MHLPACSRSSAGSDHELDRLLRQPDPGAFYPACRRLQKLFATYAATCPAPLPAHGLCLTPEIRQQCELYLPISSITPLFNRLYRAALSYEPILSSTPFHNVQSWADCHRALPEEFQDGANPALLLHLLLNDRERLIRFLFSSFLPLRFYGCGGRYPRQHQFIRHWLLSRPKRPLRCLDAACGIGTDTYGLANLLTELGWLTADTTVEGWTLEPLEVWSASRRHLPHVVRGESHWQTATLLTKQDFQHISFRCQDMLTDLPDNNSVCFDLIICNGLLGGPIVHEHEQLAEGINRLIRLLEPGGILLVANHFHGGWQQQCPQQMLRALCRQQGVLVSDAGEGFAVEKAKI